MLDVTSTILVLVLGMAPAFVAVRVSGALMGEAEWWRRGFAALCLHVLVVWALLMLLSAIGMMSRWPVVASVAVLACAAAVLPARPWNLPTGATRPGWRVVLGAGVLAAVAGELLARLYVEGHFLLSDDFAYHGPVISAWTQAASLGHERLTFPLYFPFNAHMLAFYWTLPGSDLRWEWLATVHWMAMLAAGALVLALASPRAGLAWGLVVAAALLGNREVSEFHFRTIASSDLASAAALLAAGALAVPRPGEARREALARLALCAAMGGFSAGTKVTCLVPAAIVLAAGWVAVACGEASRSLGWKRAWLGTWGTAAVPAFLTGSYWYLWNHIKTENPVFPVKVWKYNGPGNEKAFGDTTLVRMLELELATPLDVARQALDWPTPLGVLWALGLAAGLALLARGAWGAWKARSPRPLATPAIALAAGAFVVLAQYPGLPYSGHHLGGFELHVARRYFLAAFVAGMVALPEAVAWLLEARQRPWARVVADVLLVALAVAALVPSRKGVLAWSLPIGTLAAVLVVAGSRVGTVAWGRARLPLAAASLLLAAVAIAAHPIVHPPPYWTAPWGNKDLMKAMDALDALPPGSRTAQFSLLSWEWGYLYGSRSQLRATPLIQTGEPAIELHVANKKKLLAKGYPRLGVPYQDVVPDPYEFADNLRAAPVDYVLVTCYITPRSAAAWPYQREIIRNMPEFELHWEDKDYSEIYRRVRNPAEEAGDGSR